MTLNLFCLGMNTWIYSTLIYRNIASNRHWITKPWCPTETAAKISHMALRVQNLVKLHLLLPIPIVKGFVLVLERLRPKSSRVCCWIKLCCQCLVGILNLTLLYSFLSTHLKQYLNLCEEYGNRRCWVSGRSSWSAGHSSCVILFASLGLILIITIPALHKTSVCNVSYVITRKLARAYSYIYIVYIYTNIYIYIYCRSCTIIAMITHVKHTQEQIFWTIFFWMTLERTYFEHKNFSLSEVSGSSPAAFSSSASSSCLKTISRYARYQGISLIFNSLGVVLRGVAACTHIEKALTWINVLNSEAFCHSWKTQIWGIV